MVSSPVQEMSFETLCVSKIDLAFLVKIGLLQVFRAVRGGNLSIYFHWMSTSHLLGPLTRTLFFGQIGRHYFICILCRFQNPLEILFLSTLCSAQCAQNGNIVIFVPLCIYVKSILTDFRRSKTALTVLEALNFDLLEISLLKM